MRIMMWTNAPYTYTGYANQAREMLPRFQQHGHDVAVTANFGLSGATLHWNGVPIFPLREKRQNADVIGAYCQHFAADLVLSLYDIWSLPPNTRQLLGTPWAAMTPVDGTPLNNPMIQQLQCVEYPIAYSQFGLREMAKVGFEPDYIPHGFNTATYTPISAEEKVQVRAELSFPADSYVVAMIAANKGFPARKGWAEALAGFKAFHDNHPEALLYCHTTKEPYGSMGEGIHFDSLLRVLGIPSTAIAFPSQSALAIGVPDSEIAKVYRASDVLLLASMGEGFGLPIIEAQACGCPVIVQDCSAMPELVSNGVAIEPLQPLWLPQLQYFWQLPSIERITAALEQQFTTSTAEREERAAEGVEWVRSNYGYDVIWDRYWVPFLNKVEETLW